MDRLFLAAIPHKHCNYRHQKQGTDKRLLVQSCIAQDAPNAENRHIKLAQIQRRPSARNLWQFAIRHFVSRYGLVNNEIARIQVGYMEIYETYAVVIARINHSIMPANHRLEQRMRLFGLRIV
jgi:hypothetical protein